MFVSVALKDMYVFPVGISSDVIVMFTFTSRSIPEILSYTMRKLWSIKPGEDIVRLTMFTVLSVLRYVLVSVLFTVIVIRGIMPGMTSFCCRFVAIT